MLAAASYCLKAYSFEQNKEGAATAVETIACLTYTCVPMSMLKSDCKDAASSLAGHRGIVSGYGAIANIVLINIVLINQHKNMVHMRLQIS